MRLWSVHPAQLDRIGLVACWREGLLAQAVLAGRTKGYRHHPQLARFRELADPLAGVVAYLGSVADEADARGYRFDRSRLDAIDAFAGPAPGSLELTDGQLAFEWAHLLAKLEVRDEDRWERQRADQPRAHPLFRVVPGPVAGWERA